jgi:molybdopterin converting factor small subunit
MSLVNEKLSLQILLFARAAELAGSNRFHLSIQSGETVGDVEAQLVQQLPGLGQLATASRWAIDSEFVGREFVIEAPVSIALIPPVSGG